jgi:hypothetical protein
MRELLFTIMHLTEYDIYCLIIKDAKTGKSFNGKEYEEYLKKIGVKFE